MPWDFPGGSVFKNFPSNAGDTGSTPGPGTKIPHDTGQLSPHAPQLLKPVLPRAHVLQQEKFPQWEAQAPAHHNYRESAHSNKDPEQPPARPQNVKDGRGLDVMCYGQK